MNNPHLIADEEGLRAIIGEPMEFVRAKIASELDAVMKEFIERSPLIFVSTVDENGHIDTSPKGDPAGFVRVDEAGHLLIPERPGNQLAFGFRNILRNGEIGLIFLVPRQRETLRVKGTATLHCHPEVLDQMQVNGRPALLYTRVEVKECFFHCGKALIRSRLWQPDAWDNIGESLGARQFASLGGRSDREAVAATAARLEESYRDDLY